MPLEYHKYVNQWWNHVSYLMLDLQRQFELTPNPKRKMADDSFDLAYALFNF